MTQNVNNFVSEFVILCKNLDNILPLYNFTLDKLVSTITQYEGRDVISHFEILLSRKLTSRVAQYSRRDVTYPSIVFVF